VERPPGTPTADPETHRPRRHPGAGSVVGTVVGGLLLGMVAEAVLVPGLAVLLLLSSVKVWRHATAG
jgi:hypothetical protein